MFLPIFEQIKVFYFMKRLILILFFAITSLTLFAQISAPYAQLQGRYVVGNLEKAVSDSPSEGVVVVNIWVDNSGAVTRAQAGVPGTTVSDFSLWEAARSAAMKAHFNQSADAPTLQGGTISFFFSGNKSNASTSDTQSATDQKNSSPKYAKLYFTYVSGELTEVISKWRIDSIEFFDENGNIQKYSRVSGGKSSETIILNRVIEKGYKVVNSNIGYSNRDYYTTLIVEYLLEKN